MGEEISTARFRREDQRRFADQLREETALLGQWVEAGRFSENGFTLGFELEACLLDHNGFPAHINERLLKVFNGPDVVPELSRFNVEFNCTPQPAGGRALHLAEQDLESVWRRCNESAHALDANIVMIGTLPTLRESDLTLAAISRMKRYHALNNAVLRHRHGRPLHIDIDGAERLVTDHGDVMLESAATSFQIHLKTPQSLAHRYLNASMMVSGPVLAACGNSPFAFGKGLWEETRIPLFEQSVSLGDEGDGNAVQRVTFGSGYQASMVECLWENVEAFPVLLPIHFDEPSENFRHLRLHNGTIWRWNRPLVGFETDGRPHFRIEHRVLPAGPSFTDMLANAALYLGLVHHVVNSGMEARGDLPFAQARANFYEAARRGLAAEQDWPGVGRLRADALLSGELIAAARAGLATMGIDADDAAHYLDVIAARVQSGQTGSAWQRAALKANDGDLQKMMAVYCEQQRSGAPVHEWTL